VVVLDLVSSSFIRPFVDRGVELVINWFAKSLAFYACLYISNRLPEVVPGSFVVVDQVCELLVSKGLCMRNLAFVALELGLISCVAHLWVILSSIAEYNDLLIFFIRVFGQIWSCRIA
jgi:hypothetical protein